MPLELPEGVVDVWHVDLDAASDALPALSPQEEARASRFRDPQDARRWRQAHSALRQLLAGYVDSDPRVLVLATARHGKPFLAEPASEIRFNLSHAGGVALLAFARGFEVGVDVELDARRLDSLALARRLFGKEQAGRLAELPPGRRQRAFLRLWVRHEAIVKCVGSGLGESTSDEGGLWVTDLEVVDGVAAIAAGRRPRSVRRNVLLARSQSIKRPTLVSVEGR